MHKLIKSLIWGDKLPVGLWCLRFSPSYIILGIQLMVTFIMTYYCKWFFLYNQTPSWLWICCMFVICICHCFFFVFFMINLGFGKHIVDSYQVKKIVFTIQHLIYKNTSNDCQFLITLGGYYIHIVFLYIICFFFFFKNAK